MGWHQQAFRRIGNRSLHSGFQRKPDSRLTEQEFSLLAGTFFACDFVKGLWEEERKSLRMNKLTMHPALERKNLIYFAIGELERQSYSKQGWNLDHDLRRLAKPNDWKNDRKSAPSQALTKAFELSSKVMKQQYEFSKKNIQGFKHRNWFRDQETMQKITEGLEMALDLGSLPQIWP
ncbi:MAG: hypothetical protein WBD10_15095 [Acidobacteriaceae bacterium]